MAENRRERKTLYYFTRGQLALLSVGCVITSGIIFLLGIVVGQRIEEKKLLKIGEPVVKVPLQSLSSTSAPEAAKEEMTFYDTLTKVPAGKTAEKPVKEKRPVEKVAKSAAPEKRSAAKEERRVIVEKVAPGLAAKKEGPKEKKAEAAAPQGAWAVQVNAFTEEGPALALVRRLKEKGYDAYVVKSTIRGRTWYRVRVGRLATRGAARELQEILKTKEKFPRAITVSR